MKKLFITFGILWGLSINCHAGLITHNDYTAGSVITSAGQNTNENTIFNEFNGNIDNNNIKTGGIVAANLGAGSVTSAALANTLAVSSLSVTNLTVSTNTVAIETVSTATISHLVGTSTNDFATNGTVGEYVESLQTSPGNFNTSTHWQDFLQITLTAGDWDVTAIMNTDRGATTTTRIDMGISTTTGDTSTGLTLGVNWVVVPIAETGTDGDMSGVISNYRLSLNTTTTINLKQRATFSGGTPAATARLSARRMR